MRLTRRVHLFGSKVAEIRRAAFSSAASAASGAIAGVRSGRSDILSRKEAAP